MFAGRKLYGNLAHPKTIHTLWRVFHNSLPTKERLQCFGLLGEITCDFCQEIETLSYLFYECPGTRNIWQAIIDWLLWLPA